MVVGVAHRPIGRALEHQQLSHVGGNAGTHLHAAGASSDQRHPFAIHLETVVPAGGVELGTLEELEPFDTRDERAIELAHRGN